MNYLNNIFANSINKESISVIMLATIRDLFSIKNP